MKNKDVAELYNPRMDASHKVLPLPSSKSPYISNVPEVKVHPIAAGDSFVIVACDGLWDELSNHEAVTRCANFLRLAKESERGGVAQHLVEYALDKAAQRLQRQEPELGVKNRQDLLKIPPGRDGRKYLHDDITVSVVVLGTPGSRYPGPAAARVKLFWIGSNDCAWAAAAAISKAGEEAAVAKPRGRARWGEIKKSVDLIKMMNTKQSASAGKWHSLIDDLKEDAEPSLTPR